MRLFTIALLLVVTAFPAAAETRKQRAVRCAAQAEIIGQAVEMRKEKMSQADTSGAILSETDARYAPSVEVLVGYVFTLGAADLEADVKTAFEDQCNAYKP